MIWIWLVADGVVWLKLTQRERQRRKKKDGYIHHSSCLADLQFSKSTLLFSFFFKLSMLVLIFDFFFFLVAVVVVVVVVVVLVVLVANLEMGVKRW